MTLLRAVRRSLRGAGSSFARGCVVALSLALSFAARAANAAHGASTPHVATAAHAAALPRLLPPAPRIAVRAGPQRDPDEVKAAFLYHFAARHVKWPEPAPSERLAPFVIGVLGRGTIQAALEETCRGRKAGDRAIVLRTVLTAVDAAACQILFVPVARIGEIDSIVEACKGRPTLIVADSEAAVRRGAHVGFFLESAKLRFAVDAEKAKKIGLTITSELLKLARIVKTLAEEEP